MNDVQEDGRREVGSFAYGAPSSFCRMKSYERFWMGGWVLRVNLWAGGAGLQSLCEHSLCGCFVVWQKVTCSLHLDWMEEWAEYI